jgi:hypothetical protein
MLAQIDAISGIYTAFFPVIIYILLGTSRHVSMGKVGFDMKKVVFLFFCSAKRIEGNMPWNKAYEHFFNKKSIFKRLFYESKYVNLKVCSNIRRF